MNNTTEHGIELPDLTKNVNLPTGERMSRIESHVTSIYKIIVEDQNRRKEDREKQRKYDEYLDKLMQRELEDAEIRKTVMLKLVSNGAWATVVGLGSAIVYIVTENFKNG